MGLVDRALGPRPFGRRAVFKVTFEPKTARPGSPLFVTLLPTGRPVPSGGIEVVMVCRNRADGELVCEVVTDVEAGQRRVTVDVPEEVPTTEEDGVAVRDWQIGVRRVRGGRPLSVPAILWVAPPLAEEDES
jgi:hypothetical protein